MKLHDLQPAPGSRKPRTRVGRGIAAGKGKTAGRGTKGQKARAGGGIPAWFEGGQTPLHMRIPKLKGFKNRFKIEYEVVNVGAIGALADRGAFEFEDTKKSAKSGPITVNQDILRAVGLVRTLNKPLKVLGAGELSVPLFVVADAFTASARAKIEAAGGSVNVLEVPSSPLAALGVTPENADGKAPPAKGKAKTEEKIDEKPAREAADASADEPEATATAPAEAIETESPAEDDAEPTTKRGKATAAKTASKASTDKPAKASAKAAKASADADEPADDDATRADDDATADEPATTDDTASDDTATSANDTERPSGDDA
jgi:large subunit ribosomal protein L15